MASNESELPVEPVEGNAEEAVEGLLEFQHGMMVDLCGQTTHVWEKNASYLWQIRTGLTILDLIFRTFIFMNNGKKINNCIIVE